MTLKDLSSSLSERSSSIKSKNQAEEVVNLVFDLLSETLKKKEDVKIKNFGTFKIVTTKGVMRKLPGQTEAKFYPEKKKIKFVPSSKFKV